jgi:hypothetical protein
MNELATVNSSESSWRQIQPLLDDAMHQLNEKERTVIVLRFFEERSLKEVALALGLNENSAHVRIHRALERLRFLLAKRGITSTASGLATALGFGAVISAPSSLAGSVVATSLAVPTTTSTTISLIAFMTLTKLKLAIVVCLIAGLLTTVFLVREQAFGTSRLAFAGYATPEATLQTECWALSQQDYRLFLDASALAGMDPRCAPRMDPPG